jgi:hypothetical protein
LFIESEKSTTSDEERDEKREKNKKYLYWYENEDYCKRKNVQSFNIVNAFAIWTCTNKDDYEEWNHWFKNNVRCSSNRFCLKQKTKTKAKAKTITKSKTTKSKMRTNDNVEKNLINTLKQIMLKTKMFSNVFISWNWKLKNISFEKNFFFFFRNANLINDVVCSNQSKKKDKRELFIWFDYRMSI